MYNVHQQELTINFKFKLVKHILLYQSFNSFCYINSAANLKQNTYRTCCLSYSYCSDNFRIDIESEEPKELKVDADFIAMCKMHLLKHKTLALLGKLGSGRRTVANQIASRLRKIKPTLKIEVLNAFRDIPKDSIMSTIYVLPDLIKSWYTDEHTEDIIQFLQQICLDAENNCFIIATFQYDVWDYINRESKSQRVHRNISTLFPQQFPVFTEIERLREIAMNSENDISDEALKRICEVQTSIGHPLTMVLIMNNKPFSCKEYFIDPILFTIKQLKALEKSNNIRKRVKFKALVFTMLHGGEITHLELENVLDHTFHVHLKETEDRKETIQECIQQLINVYIKETTDRKSYKMIHDVITKCTFLAAAENHSGLLFSKCHYFPLLECIRHKSTSEKLSFYGKIVYDFENLQFGVPTEFYPKIAEMFVERNDLMDILHIVRFFGNKDFQAVWLKSKDPKLKKVQTEKPPTQ